MAKGFVDALGARILRIPPFSKACQPPSLQGQPTHQLSATTGTGLPQRPWECLSHDSRSFWMKNGTSKNHLETGHDQAISKLVLGTSIVNILVSYVYIYIYNIHIYVYILHTFYTVYIYMYPRKSTNKCSFERFLLSELFFATWA